MKKYFITKSEDIYKFYIATDNIVNKKRKNKRKSDVEISYELLLNSDKNRK